VKAHGISFWKRGWGKKVGRKTWQKAAFGMLLTCDGRMISIKWKVFPLWNTITIQSGRV
jgi:hypothetical protein